MLATTSKIDWTKGTIYGRHPLADRVDEVTEAFKGTIPYAAWPELQKIWQMAADFQARIKRGALEQFLDETVFAWRDETTLPVLGKRSLTASKRKELDRLTLRLTEDVAFLKAMSQERPGGAVPAGSEMQKRILEDAQAPYLWLASLIKVEIIRRGQYPKFPSPADYARALMWGLGIGTAIAVSYVGWRVGRAID